LKNKIERQKIYDEMENFKNKYKNCGYVHDTKNNIKTVFSEENSLDFDINKQGFEGYIFYGQHKKTIKDGEGLIEFSNGNRFMGAFKDDKRTGKGTLVLKNEDIYQGDWLKDHIDGFGKFTRISGDYYEGQWKDDLINGNGKSV
jgi:hypothetical protein